MCNCAVMRIFFDVLCFQFGRYLLTFLYFSLQCFIVGYIWIIIRLGNNFITLPNNVLKSTYYSLFFIFQELFTGLVAIYLLLYFPYPYTFLHLLQGTYIGTYTLIRYLCAVRIFFGVLFSIMRSIFTFMYLSVQCTATGTLHLNQHSVNTYLYNYVPKILKLRY